MSTLQTLDRGLRALDVIARSSDGITVADLARELDVHRAICYRIVATLEAHALVTRTEDGRLRLGVAIPVLASRFEPQLARDARPLLQSLADTTGATAFVSAAQGSNCVVIMVAEPEGALLRVGYRVGSSHPLDTGAAGIAILALRPEQPGDPESVRVARRDGYSLTRGQLEHGAVGIATGVALPATVTAGLERSVGVVAIDGLDTAQAADAVMRAARAFEGLVTA
ncbi:IclR family transcriptional regulator [Rhodococcus sp. RD6.2]|jgi:DNA-binding IclR family transcriptional regulator|uniref:IclR family transcriptional regulator n=1 Tax=Rhodococcus sp. RD6.2 TaxID=260936 RepID=UPI00063BA2AC|nr:helix-turn-helix domain-containing protein [Rhodococcus sp. RD6.2]CRK50799.1 IclR family transcriptional regulator [Rhodococcus sp. RD6.2]